MTEFAPGFCHELGRKCVDAKAEIERLRAELADSSWQQVERERIENERLRALLREARQYVYDEIERLRAALRDCIQSAAADGDLKESGWWDEQSIEAIENARAILEQKADTK